MKNWLADNKGFIQIPILIAIIVSVLVVSGGGYLGVRRYQNYQAEQAKKEKQMQEFLVAQRKALDETKQQIEDLKTQNQDQAKQVAENTGEKPLQSLLDKVVSKPAVVETPLAVKQPAHSPIEVSFINPAIVVNLDNKIIEIHGSGFKKGLTVSAGDSYLELSTNFDPNPQPGVIFVRIPAGMSPGLYTIEVKNLDGEIATLDRSLTIVKGLATQDDYLSTIEIANRLKQAVVLIRTETATMKGCGSGIVIDRNQILTNNYVVRDVSSAKVLLNGGQVLSATVTARDQSKDLALLTPAGDQNLPFATFFSSDEQSLPIGSEVVALGYPLTCNEDFTLVAEEGNITGRRDGFLQTSARIHCGNSGGPLVEKKTGQVIGINTRAVTLDCYNVTGIGLAVPSDLIWPWLVDVRSR